MTYEEALNYIHTVSWRGSIPGLSRTRELLRLLGDPQDHLRFIHVGGTNGKGSTCKMLSCILEDAGLKVGLYTSPYIDRFNERMQVNGLDIPDDVLAAITEEVMPYAESMQDHPTEFELITAMALLWFQREQCDVVVLEVGMGGELDSTNVIERPDLCVLTAMGYDHTRELGSTMTEIASAKAGIIKEGTVVVSYGTCPEADAVFTARAEAMHATLVNPDFSLIEAGEFSIAGQHFSYGIHRDLFIHLAGAYQLKNAAVVLTCVEQLRKIGYSIPEEAVVSGLARTAWPGRFEVLSELPVFIVDGGHNPHGIGGTKDSLEHLFPYREFIFICGFMADKDIPSILGSLVPLAKRFYCVRPDNPRAMAADVLAEKITALGAKAIPCESVEAAVKEAFLHCGDGEVICATGSLYMCGAVRACFQKC